VRKGVEQHLVLVQERATFLLVSFSAILLNHDKHIEEKGSWMYIL
jgi:hypothetical protein